jgi:hypothetical protein
VNLDALGARCLDALWDVSARGCAEAAVSCATIQVNDVLRGGRSRTTTTLAVLAAAVLTSAVALVIVSCRGNDEPTLKIFIAAPNGAKDSAPAEFNEFATSLYEGLRKYCQQRWSALVFEAGEAPTAFSRSALRDIAAKLPPANRFTDELLRNIATDGCVAGFLEMLKRDRAYALS